MGTGAGIITQALNRLDNPTRWTRAELLVFLNDALHELNLVAGAFQSAATITVTGTANVYAAPSGTVAPLAISSSGRYLLRRTISDLDDESDWEKPEAARLRVSDWAPLGLTKIVIFPRPLSSTILSVERLTEHTAATDGTTALPLPSEYDSALEDYVVGRALFKEGGPEVAEGAALHKRFLDTVQELAGRRSVQNYPVLEVAKTATAPT